MTASPSLADIRDDNQLIAFGSTQVLRERATALERRLLGMRAPTVKVAVIFESQGTHLSGPIQNGGVAHCDFRGPPCDQLNFCV